MWLETSQTGSIFLYAVLGCEFGHSSQNLPLVNMKPPCQDCYSASVQAEVQPSHAHLYQRILHRVIHWQLHARVGCRSHDISELKWLLTCAQLWAIGMVALICKSMKSLQSSSSPTVSGAVSDTVGMLAAQRLTHLYQASRAAWVNWTICERCFVQDWRWLFL